LDSHQVVAGAKSFWLISFHVFAEISITKNENLWKASVYERNKTEIMGGIPPSLIVGSIGCLAEIDFSDL
jgi:hypothetical protein